MRFIIVVALWLLAMQAEAAILVVSPNGNVTQKTTLALAATDADTVNKTIVVTSALSAVQSNISSATLHAWPANRALKVEKGGSINPTTKFTGLTYATPEMFGAVGDGSADDTTPTHLAVKAVKATGGTVWFDSKRYSITPGVIIINSTYPVSLKGNQNGALVDASTGPGILVRSAATGSLFRYEAESAASRGSGPSGGVISGLNFYDPTHTGLSHAQGTRGITAALDLNDFIHSTVENCNFRWIKGSAILGEFVVMSSILNNTMVGCGDTNKPTVYFPSTSGDFPAQSVNISFNKVERCWSAPYVSLKGAASSPNPSSAKILSNGFEAETTEAGTNQTYVYVDAGRTQVNGNHFNQTTATAVDISNSTYTLGVTLSDNTFSTSASASPVISNGGKYTRISKNYFNDLRTVHSVNSTGDNASFIGNTMYASGGVVSTGNWFIASSNNILSPTLTAGFSLDTSGDFANISGNVLDGLSTATCGGIKFGGTLPIVNGNSVSNFNAVGAIGYDNDTSNAVITGNTESTCTVGYSPGTGVGQASSNQFATGPIPLQGSATVNYGTLVAGAISAGAVTIAEATTSDFAVGSISGFVSGLSVTAVPVAGSVNVYVHNTTGAPIVVGSVTVNARVIKK